VIIAAKKLPANYGKGDNGTCISGTQGPAAHKHAQPSGFDFQSMPHATHKHLDLQIDTASCHASALVLHPSIQALQQNLK
jgi:hypothetical protein